MNATSKRPTSPERLAPSVEPDWVRSFVTEQNLRGVPPQRIGDQLVTVESHVRESGESAEEAFGDPAEYARALPAGGEWKLGRRTVLELALGLAGMLLVLAAFNAWLAGERIPVTTGSLVMLGILAVSVAILLARPGVVLRLIVERPVLGWVVSLTPFTLFVASLLLLPTELATLPVVPPAVVGVVALVASSTLAALNPEEDEITGPGERPRRSAVARRVGVLLYPLLTLAMMVLAWVPTLFV